jgi:hypothetical protein
VLSNRTLTRRWFLGTRYNGVLPAPAPIHGPMFAARSRWI